MNNTLNNTAVKQNFITNNINQNTPIKILMPMAISKNKISIGKTKIPKKKQLKLEDLPGFTQSSTKNITN